MSQTDPRVPIVSRMLDVDSATSFLLERGLIDNGWIVGGTLKIRSEARRNRNLRIEGSRGEGFLIKQPDDQSHGGHATLRMEAAFHQFCRREPVLERLTHFIPRLLDVDLEMARLVFELIPNARPFQSTLAAGAGADRQTAIASARELGKNLAILHQSFRPASIQDDDRLAKLPRHRPWAIGLHKPEPSLLAMLSPANYRTLRILQTEEGLVERLDRLRHEWRPETVIHGDMKFDNILIQADHKDEASKSVRIWIVDWEMAQIGDPAWDLAGALQDFLVLWVRSMPMAEALNSEERIARGRLPLGDLQDAIRALWDGYRVAANLAGREADELLRRSVIFSAARLIQTAYEMMLTAQQLSKSPLSLIQIAANILAEPRRGQVQLYGIPWRDSLS